MDARVRRTVRRSQRISVSELSPMHSLSREAEGLRCVFDLELHLGLCMIAGYQSEGDLATRAI
jgi:hypothetical protein